MIEFVNESPLKEPIIFDTHAHYDDERFSGIETELFKELNSHGVGGILTCGCDAESSKKALELAKTYDFVYSLFSPLP